MTQISTSFRRRALSYALIWITLHLLSSFASTVSAQVSSAACNSFTAVTNPGFSSLSVTSSQVPVFGGDEFSSKGNLIDDDAGFTTAATFSFAIGGSAWLSVQDLNATGANVYPAGSFAGFIVNDNSLLNTVGTVTISTYLGTSTTPVDTKTSSSLLSNGLLSGKSRIGFYSAGAFDRIRIDFSGLVAGSLSVYAPIVEKFCNTSPTLSCNTPTSLTAPGHSVFINPDRTGISGVACVACGIVNSDNAIDNNSANSASIVLTGGLAVTGSIAVKNRFVTYPANTFAGFDIVRPTLANIGVFDGLTVSTYITGNPNPVQTFSGTDLISANGTILSGSGRRTVGFLASQPFDEVRLTVSQLAGVTLGTTSVYGVIATSFCSAPSLDCADNTLPKNTLIPLTNPTHPVYVDGKNTSILGAACVGCSINNSENIVDNNSANFATVVLTAGVSTSATVAVANALQTYPINSFAGFDIQINTLVSAAVLSRATISLYNNGALVQTGTGNAFIVGATTDLLTGRSRQIVGIVAKAAYDEVKLTIPSFVGLDLGTINIYSAIFEKTCTATIVCNTAYNLSSPSFPVVIDGDRTGVTGAVNVATTIQDPWNVVSASTTDFARITNLAAVATNASIAVVDPISTYPTGTFAGFALRKVSGLVTADLFSKLTVTTYLDGEAQESRTAGSLLDLSIVLFGTTTDFLNAGFVTTKPFDEIQLTVAPLVGLGVLSGNLDVYGAFVDTRTSTGGGLVCALNTNPDVNVTNKNVPVSGNVKTNDLVPVGTTYGPAPTSTTQPAGSSPSLTVNADGTYTFVSSTPGQYVYAIPVCGSGLSGTSCATQTLTITVLDPTVNTNKPVANPDVATTTGSPTNATAITINVRVNDGPGNPGGTLGTPTIATGPAHGTASIVNGNLVYTPTAGYYGADLVTYQVCETPGTNLCATATVTITVNAPDSPNTTVAADDYVSTYQSLTVTGNVKTNDSDPEGNTQTVTAQTTTVPGKGTLALTSDGKFIFTPVAGATGPVDFTYTTCDNGSPSVCANGTLHVLVNPFNPNPDFAVTNKTVPVTGSVKTNDVIPVGATYGPAPSPASQPASSSPTLTVNTDGTYTFSSTTPGVYVYNVPVCAPAPPTYCTTQTLTITVLDPAVTNNPPVANPDFVTTTGNPTSATAITINVRANDGPGNPGGTLGTPTIATGPAHGTASIVNGNLVYTPTAGYYGTDLVTYQVCETPGTNLCATATVTITVKAPGLPATVSINDDYVSTSGGTPATGNVLTNDLGNTLTVSNAGTTTTSSGTLVITATGSFTFTPAPGVTGPATFTYTACDNSTPSVCGSATLHVLVGLSRPDLTPIIRLPLTNFTASGPNSSRQFTVELTEVNGQSTSSGNIVFTIGVPLGYTLTFDNTLTSINVSGGFNNPVVVDNTKWTPTASNSRQITLIIAAGQFISANGVATIGFTATRAGANTGNLSNITTNISVDNTGTYDTNPLNNVYALSVNSL
ncbi:beta strand repeat-containing protein [Spirosoma pollinicola]|uniref:Tandem-95 repeat protein n=1 Tax=Spirosoma pollinicola TaxID=2057025 RepID=A0A2K8YXY1_9BACT|nr:Ig-like domain-containing protein [Spirosoma pollinicola]AUD02481.1 hypothetical protein CWM47_11980 [Spirosoma pollinicola]